MSTKLSRLIQAAALAAALPLFAACSSTGSTKEQPGAVAVDTAQITAMVKVIDKAKRIVTLAGPKGKRATCKVGMDAVNFDRIRVGDKVTATLTEAVAVYLRDRGTPPSAGEGAAVVLAPMGSMPGAAIVATSELTAKILSVDAATNHITLPA